MPPEPDNIAEAFRSAYRRLVETTPPAKASWPPVSIAGVSARADRRRPGWMTAAAAFLITGAFWIGWLAAPRQPTRTADPFQIQAEETAPAVPDTASAPHASPSEAALAAALAQVPTLDDARVTRMVGIYADDTTVDLRVQVQANDFCHWYGVTGRVDQGSLEWRGGPALSCDE